MLFVLVFAVFALAYGPHQPANPQRELPLAQVDRYTAEDFFTAAAH